MAARKQLQESKELCQTVLENISDAVFITDKRGNFVFICSNVNIIFGLSSAAIDKLGNIEAILGTDLFDFHTLDAEGEVRNIERDIKDSKGRVHSLLVNVKKVRIKGETLLYTCRDVTDCKQAEIALRKAYEELDGIVKKRTLELLERQKKRLKESNIALKVLLRNRENEKQDYEEQIGAHIVNQVEPYLEKITNGPLNNKQKRYMEIIAVNLKELTTPTTKLSLTTQLKLSPMEIRISQFVKQGYTSKEIADLLTISHRTVEKHRRNIRKKIGLTNKKMSLRTLLLS